MTEYTVALKNMVSGPAAQAKRDAEALRDVLVNMEGARYAAAGRRSGGEGAAARAAQREQAMNLRVQADAIRSAQRAEDAKRNAAFRRLQAQQRDEERFAAYRIRLTRRELAERERAEKQAAAAHARMVLQSQRGGPGGGGMGSLAALGLRATIGGAALGIGAYVGKEALDTAKQIEQAKMRLTALLGSEQAAAAEIKDMVRAAAKTKFDWQDLVDATSSLSASFGDTAERRYVLASISDMVSVAGEGKQTLDQVILAVNQVMGKGKLEAEELNQIIEPLKGVVSRRDFYKEVARLMDVKAKDDNDLMSKMAKKQKAGEIGARTAIQALTNVGRAKAGGGAAGSFAVKAGDTIEGQISNIKTGLGTLFAMTDVQTWPAMLKLKDALGAIANFFNADSRAAKDFIDLLKIATSATAWTMEAMVKMFTAPTEAAYNFVNFIRDAIDASAFTGVTDWEAWGALGRNICRGIAEGVKAGAEWVYDAIRELAHNVVEELKRKLHIASPSRVMMQLGAYTSEGYAQGIARAAHKAAAAGGAMAGMVATAAAAAPGAGASVIGAAGSSGNTYNVTLISNITGSGDPVETAQRSAAANEMMLDRYFGRLLAAQGG